MIIPRPHIFEKILEFYSIFKSFYMKIKTQFEDHDIIHQSSCPHTPQLNNVAQRKLRRGEEDLVPLPSGKSTIGINGSIL
jgi:hypothetical protein